MAVGVCITFVLIRYKERGVSVIGDRKFLHDQPFGIAASVQPVAALSISMVLVEIRKHGDHSA